MFPRRSLVGPFYLVILFGPLTFRVILVPFRKSEGLLACPPLFLVALVSIVFARFLWVIHFSFVGPSCDPRLLELSVLLEAGGTVGVMAFIKRVLVIIPILMSDTFCVL